MLSIVIVLFVRRRSCSNTDKNASSGSSSGSDPPTVETLDPPSRDESEGGGATRVLPQSSTSTLVTLTLVTRESATQDIIHFQPIGRSYQGQDREQAAGVWATQVNFTCDDETVCQVVLPPLEEETDGTTTLECT